MNKAQWHEVSRVWDSLAELGPSEVKTGVKRLMDFVCGEINSGHGYWLGAVRMKNPQSRDVFRGWRVARGIYHNPIPLDQDIFKLGVREMQDNKPNESSVAMIKDAGNYRSYLQRDIVSKDFYKSAHYEILYRSRNIHDSIFVVAPVNKNAECYFGFHRLDGQPRFTRNDLEIATDSLRGLKWFYKQIMLSFGLYVSESPLTTMEQKILGKMLSHRSEKDIAGEMKQKPSTTHQHVKNIYRKFNVSSRAALTSLWLNNM